MLNNDMFAVDPTELVEARELCHAAVQWASKAARANLVPKVDDSHSNLGWVNEHFGLVSHFLDAEQRIQLGFNFLERALLWVVDGRVDSSFDLTTGSEATVQVWVDEHLAAADLRATPVAEMPYQLPAVDYAEFAGLKRHAVTLGHWYAAAHVALNGLVDRFRSMAVTEPVVRCWPHHFDIAALFVLDEGDVETARSIGVGLSPGDESYSEPYFYCSPWPAPDTKSLATPLPPWRWHTEGFVSLVCTASSLSVLDDLGEVLVGAVDAAKRELPDVQ